MAEFSRPRPGARAPQPLLALLALALVGVLGIIPSGAMHPPVVPVQDPARQTPAREAYVSLLYGDAYVLPLRVMMRSLAENSRDVASGERDRVVLVTGSMAPESIRRLVDDGLSVIAVPTVDTPYPSDDHFQKRFLSVMTKLVIFNLTQYDKLVFLDADALVLRDLSDLFRCGAFCAAFINPCHFNSGLMLVTPSTPLFNDMIQKLPTLPSYDGGDQGFLNAYFPEMLSAPMFVPTAGPPSKKVAFARLPFTFHMDHSAYYPRFRWSHSKSRCGLEMREEEWLGPTFMKPWLWFTYAILDQSWVWHEYRRKLVSPYPTGERTSYSAYSLIALSYLATVPLFILLCGRTASLAASYPMFANHSPQKTGQVASARLQYLLFHVLPYACPFPSSHRRYGQLNAIMAAAAAYGLGFAISFASIPPLVPPYLGTAAFVHVRSACNFLLFIVLIGSILCCGQLDARSGYEPHGAVGASQCSTVGLKPPAALSRIVLECAVWSIIDGAFLSASFFVLWQIPFKVLLVKVSAFIIAVVLHAMMTVWVLVRVTSMWLRWASVLPPLRQRRAVPRRLSRET
jgi:inositol phosphorylceramide glucuronosyltransferase 1